MRNGLQHRGLACLTSLFHWAPRQSKKKLEINVDRHITTNRGLGCFQQSMKGSVGKKIVSHFNTVDSRVSAIFKGYSLTPFKQKWKPTGNLW